MQSAGIILLNVHESVYYCCEFPSKMNVANSDV